MSQIKKSASFRSRIPIRRAKPIPRRCYSPEPYKNRSTSSMYDQHQITNDAKPQCHSEQRMSKQKIKRQRHFATTTTNPSNDTSIMSAAPNISARPKTIYSSSSYSSSDESQASESLPQVRFFFKTILFYTFWWFEHLRRWTIFLNMSVHL